MAKNRPRRVAIFLLFRLASLTILVIPTRIGLMLGQAFGRLCFYILRKERKKALRNLDTAFGDSKSNIEKREITKRVFENLGKSVIEILSIPKFTGISFTTSPAIPIEQFDQLVNKYKQ